MAVAAAFGGVSPNFDPLYKEVTRLSKNLSIASPREINNPGETLQLKIRDKSITNSQPQTFDIYMKPFYDKEGTPITYELFYKNGNNDEIAITKARFTGNPPVLTNQVVQLDTNNIEYSINGQVIDNSDFSVTRANQLFVDVNSGRIVFRRSSGTATAISSDFDANTQAYVPGSQYNIDLGIVKFDGATGLDVGLINDRISQVNLTIEALNKVLLVASGMIDKGLETIR